MTDINTGPGPEGTGRRIASARRRQGLTQKELARASGLSVSSVRKAEQGALTLRTESLRKLAGPLRVSTSALMGPPQEDPEPVNGALWAPVRDAVLAPGRPGGGDPDAAGLESALDAAVRLYHDNRYEELARVLPPLLADTRDAPPALRAQAGQLAGSVMVQTRNRDAAAAALQQSLADAEATGDELAAGSAVITLCWLWLTEGRFGDVRHLAAEWADRVEPRMSTATVRELSVWGWLLLRGSAAAIRDNDPGEAADMMRLATAAAAATGRDQGGYRMYWTTFGPATTAMKRVENALVDGRPDVALRLADAVPPGLRPTSDNRNRHLLDVSAAHLELRDPDESLAVLLRLRAEAGPWLAEQRMARDILDRIVRRRRTLTADMRDLADAIRLPL